MRSASVWDSSVAVTLVVMAIKIERIELAPILVYVIGLITMLAFSAAYNMWPVSPVKWVLRRLDHSAIYLSTPSHLPSPARAYGCSRSGAFSIRSARSSMSGGACAFTTPSGMVLCYLRQVVIIRQSSLACPGNKRPVQRAHSRNRLDNDRAGRRRSGSRRRSLRGRAKLHVLPEGSQWGSTRFSVHRALRVST